MFIENNSLGTGLNCVIFGVVLLCNIDRQGIWLRVLMTAGGTGCCMTVMGTGAIEALGYD